MADSRVQQLIHECKCVIHEHKCLIHEGMASGRVQWRRHGEALPHNTLVDAQEQSGQWWQVARATLVVQQAKAHDLFFCEIRIESVVLINPAMLMALQQFLSGATVALQFLFAGFLCMW